MSANRMTAAEVRAHVRKHMGKASQADMARVLRVSPQYFGDVMSGRREPGEKFLRELGLRRQIRYVPKEASRD